MLTATYAFVELLMEQKRTYNLLFATQRLLQLCVENRRHLDVTTLKPVIELFAALDKICRSRGIEMYLIPVVQKTSKEADLLFAELESSNAIGRQLLDSVMEWVRLVSKQKFLMTAEPYAALELYCNNLLERLVRETKELLPLAQCVISSEEWFSIGVKLLSDDIENTVYQFMTDSRSGCMQD